MLKLIRKKLFVSLALFVFVYISLTAIFLFTTPQKRIPKIEGSGVTIIQDLANIRVGSYETSNNSKSPDTNPATKKKILEITLTESQVVDLVEHFIPSDLLLKDFRFEIHDGYTIVEATSLYPITAGIGRCKVSVLHDNYLKLDSISLGRVYMSTKLASVLESELNRVLTQTMASYGVTLLGLEMKEGNFVGKVQLPTGLVEIEENGNLIIHTEPVDRSSYPSASSTN